VATEWAPQPRRANASGGGNTRFTWGCGGLLLGVLLTTLFLVLLAPHPSAVALAPAAPADITLTVDDQYLTRLVVQGIKAANLPAFTVTNVKAHIAAGNVLTFSGSAALGPGISLANLNAQGQLGASGGLLVVSHLSGVLGGLTLPAVVDSALELGINIAITNERQRLTQGGITYYVEGISTTDGRLTLTLSFS
jgi:hypothetical protein